MTTGVRSVVDHDGWACIPVPPRTRPPGATRGQPPLDACLIGAWGAKWNRERKLKAFFELLGFVVERLTGRRRKGTRRLPHDSRRARIVGVLAAAGVAGALAIYGLSQLGGQAPSSQTPVVAAPTDEVTTPEASGAPVKTIRPVPPPAAPTTGRSTAEATVAPTPTHTEVESPVSRVVRRGASCSPAGAVGYTSEGRRVTCQGPGRVRWR